MTYGVDAAEARRRAHDLWARGAVLPELPRCAFGESMAVLDPHGRFHSWLVPLTRGLDLMGWIGIGPDGTLLQASAFGKPMPVAAWTDTADVLRRATELSQPGEELGTPVLSFDSVPARIAWAVPVTGADGTGATIYVVGDVVYRSGRGSLSPDEVG